jgi:hypothetical protein
MNTIFFKICYTNSSVLSQQLLDIDAYSYAKGTYIYTLILEGNTVVGKLMKE